MAAYISHPNIHIRIKGISTPMPLVLTDPDDPTQMLNFVPFKKTFWVVLHIFLYFLFTAMLMRPSCTCLLEPQNVKC